MKSGKRSEDKVVYLPVDNLFCLCGQHHAFVAVLKATMSLAPCVATKVAAVGTIGSKL